MRARRLGHGPRQHRRRQRPRARPLRVGRLPAPRRPARRDAARPATASDDAGSAPSLCGMAASPGVAAPSPPAPGRRPGRRRPTSTLVLADQPFTVAAERSVDGDVRRDRRPRSTPSAARRPRRTTTTTPATPPPPTLAVTAPTRGTGATAEVRVARAPPGRRPRRRSPTVLDGAGCRSPTASRTRSMPVRSTTAGRRERSRSTWPTAVDPDVADALTLRRPGLYPVTVAAASSTATSSPTTTRSSTGCRRRRRRRRPMSVAVVAATSPTPVRRRPPAELAAGRAELDAIADSADAVGGPITVRDPARARRRPRRPTTRRCCATLRSSLAGAEVLAAAGRRARPVVGRRHRTSRTRSPATCCAGEDVARRGAAGVAAAAVRLAGADDRSARRRRRCCATPRLRPARARPPTSTTASTAASAATTTRRWRSTSTLGDGPRCPASSSSPLSHWLDPATLDRDGLSPDRRRRAPDGRARHDPPRARRRRCARSVVLAAARPASCPTPRSPPRWPRFVAETPDFALAPLSALPGATDTDGRRPDDGPQVGDAPRPSPDPTSPSGPTASTVTRLAAAGAGVDAARRRPSSTAWNAELDTLLSTGLDDATGRRRAGPHRRRGRRRATPRSSVPQPFTFTLTGRARPLRLNIRNIGDDAVQVVVRPSSSEAARSPTATELGRARPRRRHRGRDPRRGPVQRHVVAIERRVAHADARPDGRRPRSC